MNDTRKPIEPPDEDNPQWTAEDMAKARPAAYVLPELVEEQRWQRLYAYGQERARRLGLTNEADVERLVRAHDCRLSAAPTRRTLSPKRRFISTASTTFLLALAL